MRRRLTLLKSLIDSARRFNNLAKIGYDEIRIRWILDLEGPCPRLLDFRKTPIIRLAPVVGDRSGTVSDTNSKPALLADKAAYALGVIETGEVNTESIEHMGFRDLASKAAAGTNEHDVKTISTFLSKFGNPSDTDSSDLRRKIREAKIKPNEIVAFMVTPDWFAFEEDSVATFWKQNQADKYAGKNADCGLCGENKPTLRILPWQVSLAGYSCPISASNGNAFYSFGKEQTANSPMCFDCASTASQVLQYLLNSERHHRFLTRDESKGTGKSPLRNQVAVFWLKEQPPVEIPQTILIEDAFAEPLYNDDRKSPPPDPEHVKAFYDVPWSHHSAGLNLDQNQFFLAILSPNKSRLVVRDWIELNLATACERLQTFDSARRIISVDGEELLRITIPGMLKALKPWRSSTATLDANHVRGLVRTAYAGAQVPSGLLESAVRRFRIPDRPKNAMEQKEMQQRRAALAAVIKLALTYGTKEAQTLQSNDESRKTAPYLCGQLLAILEEAQARASNWRIGSTLVDRFYSSASTSPRGVLTLLLKRATTDHFPKLRKNNLGYGHLSEKLENAMKNIDNAGGFPMTLSMWDQGDFALGFYHQRATFHSDRTKARAEKAAKLTGELTNAAL